ncbi:right-handed parallel beta-helix repeat-containing protein [Botrimarina sp.]|uniref:right-handed parallel beta-helix repeat-containing protein n=1 Tax=Botrimarina sp. TaxID=2795802 RepID=UPI0032EB2B4F
MQDRIQAHGGRRRKARARPRRAELSLERLEPRTVLATVYPLANAGFEEPDLADGAPPANGAAGWSVSGAPRTSRDSPAAPAGSAAEGDQFLLGDASFWSLSQSGPTVAAGRRYLLSLDVAPLASGDSSLSVLLRANGAIVAGAGDFVSANPAIRFVDIPEGQWTRVVVGFSSDALPSFIGQTLEVRVGGSHYAVDNVRLVEDADARDFYVSAAPGSAGDGATPDAPLAGLSALAPYLPLLPGERVLLRAGDVFTEELNLRGKGTPADPITVSRYGDGPNPILRPDDLEFGRGLVWTNPSHAQISGIDVERAKIGFYLRYEFDDPGGENVQIEDSHFRDLSDPTLDPSKHNFEYAWSDAIWVGGQAWNDAEFSTRLDGLTIRNVSSTNAAHLFGTGWYFPAPYKSRVTNLLIEDSVAYGNLAGAFQLFGVDGGVIRRVHSIGGGGQDTWSGTTLGFVQDSRNLLIEQSEFAYIDRAQAADGSGMDFEGNSDNVTFRDNVVHSNAGSGLLILGTGGRNTNLVIERNVFYNNAVDPWNSEINSEAQGSNDTHTGVLRDNVFYRGDPSINFLSPGANWSGFVQSGNQYREYGEALDRPTRWEFDTDGDTEGWGGLNDWAGAAVAGGVFGGASSGPDPFVESPATWANSRETPYVWIRMRQATAGAAQLFYQTENDPTWSEAKSAAFSVIADGEFHDYFVDLGGVTYATEVISRLRIDPSMVSGDDFAIDFVRFTDSTDPAQSPPAAPLPAPQSARLVSIASEDGHVLESARDSGVGGSFSSGEWYFRLGDDASNRAYRPVLSFDTGSLPDDAIITQATIGITRRGGPTGTIPIGVADSPWGDLIVDLASPAFGAEALQASDWHAAATQQQVSKFAWPAYSDRQTIYSRLDDPHLPLVSTTDRTQFRVRYANDDDGDGVADYMPYATSNHPNSTYHPTLTVEYYRPSLVAGDYDLNGLVDQADYGVWRRNYGSTFGVGLLADGNRDGRVDAADYSVWRDALHAAPALGAVESSVDPPEAPTAFAAYSLVAPLADAPEDPLEMQSSAPPAPAAGDTLLLLAADEVFAEWSVADDAEQPPSPGEPDAESDAEALEALSPAALSDRV